MSLLRRGRHVKRMRRGSKLLVLTGVLLFGMGATAVFADGGTLDVEVANNTQYANDQTTDGAIVEYIGSVHTDFGSSGSGTFDAFLRTHATPNEEGYNSDLTQSDFEFDEVSGAFTHSILVSEIPIVDCESIDGSITENGLCWELFADINDSNSTPLIQLTDLEIYFSGVPSPTGYPFGLTPVYDFSGEVHINDVNPGSGRGDLRYLVPLTGITTPTDCEYGNPACETYFVLYTRWGAEEGSDYTTDAGFNEWKVREYPIVTVDKSVDITLDRTFPWNVEKSADVESIDLFAGESGTINWTVTATVGTPVDSNRLISGEIEIFNPTGVGEIEARDAQIANVEDVLTLGGVDHDATVVCPEELPFDLGDQETLTCTYSFVPTTTEDGSNLATVTLNVLDDDDDIVDTVEQTDTEAVSFGDAEVNEVDECVEVTDDNATPGDTSDDTVLDSELCEDESPGVYMSSTDVGPFDVEECDSVTITNTAFTVTNDTEADDEASDSVDVDCYELTVTKDADEALTRTHPWDLAKEADVGSIDLFAGESATINWTVTATVGQAVDSGHTVEGAITISNPAPKVADDVAVADVISHAVDPDITATVDCDPVTMGNQTSVDVPAADISGPGTAECSYSAGLPDSDDRTNTAIATLFEVDYTGTADVDFSDVEVTEVDECVEVTDDNATPGDTSDDTVLDSELCEDESPGVYMFSTDVGPFDVEECDSVTITNTAFTETNDTETDDEASDSVDVNCHELTVTKDADTSYTRDYDWDIAKTRFIADGEDDGDGDPLTLTLMTGQVFTASYEVTVTMTGVTDSDHAVEGTITITNPAPNLADDVAVSDVLSGPITADIDCDPLTLGNQSTVDVPAADMGVPGTASCDYSADLPNADSRTNTATATLFSVDYTGNADVTFDMDNPSEEIDDCIDVIDDGGTPADISDDIGLGTVCVDDLDENDQWSDTYTIDIGPFEACGEFEFTNTVSFETTDDDNDTDEADFATYTVSIDVPCPEGCSLTQGYWKTHNETFWGGAPTDDTWVLIGDADGDMMAEAESETFYLSGQTYFEVMWTAPQGNAYYNLASQYIAAVLNGLNGADTSVITTELADAEALFQTYTPAEIAELKGKNGKELRAEFIALAGTLASYNEGDIGPGHCDEDGTSAVALMLLPFMAVRRRWTA